MLLINWKPCSITWKNIKRGNTASLSSFDTQALDPNLNKPRLSQRTCFWTGESMRQHCKFSLDSHNSFVLFGIHDLDYLSLIRRVDMARKMSQDVTILWGFKDALSPEFGHAITQQKIVFICFVYFVIPCHAAFSKKKVWIQVAFNFYCFWLSML